MHFTENNSLQIQTHLFSKLLDPLVVFLEAVECSYDVVFAQLRIKVLLQSQLPIRHLIFIFLQLLGPNVGNQIVA